MKTPQSFEEWFAQSPWAGAGKDAGELAGAAWNAAVQTCHEREHEWAESSELGWRKLRALRSSVTFFLTLVRRSIPDWPLGGEERKATDEVEKLLKSQP